MLFIKPRAPDMGQSRLLGMLLAAFPSEATYVTHSGLTQIQPWLDPDTRLSGSSHRFWIKPTQDKNAPLFLLPIPRSRNRWHLG